MKYAQKWEDRISGEFVSKYTVFSHKGGVRILADNPKDLNKNKGLKLSPLFLFIYWSYLYVSTCAIPLFRMAQEVKYSLFMGESAQVAYPNRAPKKFVTFWEEEERRQPQRAKRVLCCKAVLTSGPPMMSKTVLDLLHSLGVEDDMIMFDNFGG